MRKVRIFARWAAALVMLISGMGMAACDGSGTGGSELPGGWRAEVAAGPGRRIEHRLEIRSARYTWTESVYGPDGRPEDGLVDRFTHSGRWRMQGDRMTITYEPPPHVSFARPPLYFQREE